MIEMQPIQAYLRPSRNDVWVAETVVNGKDYRVTHSSAMSALARMLIDDGVDPTTPIVFGHEGLAGHVTWTSLRAAATQYDRGREVRAKFAAKAASNAA